ncbi:MAG: DUF2147 domain-containing protein [Taibaiella sp.]|nr:DUF2147 domain-containing protein [Taibaiella sp.]
MKPRMTVITARSYGSGNPMKNGQPKTDKNNPDKSRRGSPLMNLLVLRGFTKKSATSFEGGTIYDPKNGKTYDCKMTLKGDLLDIRGYSGYQPPGQDLHLDTDPVKELSGKQLLPAQ